MNKQIVATGTILVVTGIVLGAFGAHALKELVSAQELVSFETGVRYQMYHGLGFLAIGLGADRLQVDLKWFYRLVMAGVFLFSVSIYLLALKEYIGMNPKILGPITPIGGVLMISGWILLIKNLLLSK